jgi:tetratricopeptide (TPR) repeat protein/transcriptional regulator with XRE-family HTH domain
MDDEAETLRALIGCLRALHGGNQKQMAAAVGLHPSTISRFEDGRRLPEQRHVEKFAQAVNLPMWFVDGALRPVLSQAAALARGVVPAGAGDAGDVPLPEGAAEALGAVARAAMAEFAAGGGSLPSADDAPTAAPSSRDPWNQLAEWAAEPPRLVEPALWPQFETLCVTLCEQSVHAAASDPARALGLARLALAVAELAPGEPAWQLRGRGFAWGFIGNARRVGGDLLAARSAFDSCWRLWRVGSPPPATALGEWRLLDLEASLCRAERQFEPALNRLDRALASAPSEARGRILLNKASILEQAGEFEAALATLREAAPLVAAMGEPRHLWVHSMNLVTTLCDLGQLAEAEERFPALQALTAELRHDLDQLRVRWLAGRIAAGRGRRAEARAAFEQVRAAFVERCIGYDAALVSLDLAALCLDEGRTAEVRSLAEEMLAVFRSLAVHREALAAVVVWTDAARAETVTVELLRSVRVRLQRAPLDPACATRPRTHSP